MKKIIFLILVFVLGVRILIASIITPDDAQKVAEKFYKQFSNEVFKSTTLAYTKMSPVGEPEFYVFNVNENDGYVVIAANENALPVINYSTEGQFSLPVSESKVEKVETWESSNWTASSSDGYIIKRR